MGTGAGQADLFADQAPFHQPAQFPAGGGGAHRVGLHPMQKLGFLGGFARVGQFLPGAAGGFPERGQGGLVVGAGYGRQPGTLVGAETRGQQRRRRLKGGAQVGLSQPVRQLYALGADQRRRLYGMQNVARFRLGYGGGVGQADHQPLHEAAPELHPHQLARLHRPMPGNAVGEGASWRDPVGVNGDIGVVHWSAAGARPAGRGPVRAGDKGRRRRCGAWPAA